MRRFAAALAVVGLGVGPGGCALGITGPRKGAPVAQPPKCERGRGGVVADGVLGAGFGIGGVVGLRSDEEGLGLVSMLVGGLLIASAVHGNGQASACDRANVKHDAYVAARVDDDQPRPVAAPVPVRAQTAPSVPREPIAKLPTPAQAAQALVAPEEPAKQDDEDDRWSAFWEASP